MFKNTLKSCVAIPETMDCVWSVKYPCAKTYTYIHEMGMALITEMITFEDVLCDKQN